MSRVVHFELPVDNLERAQKFYSDVFGWKITKWQGPMDYWMVTSGPDSQPGINGALTRRSEMNPATSNTIGVESVDKAIEAVTKAGGKILMPKSPIPGIGWFTYCADTEGNIFGLMQPDANAR
jgi:predicted enzyme related to lactoylglutathione lyase